MEQFSLDKYLENPSRKVVTRRGNPVRIICTDRKHGEDTLPIVFLEESPDGIGEFLLSCRADGTCDNYDTQYDLFFADEEEESQSIEIPFGAFDSEFVRDEYYIPEGCEARIEGNKVIIERVQKEEELTELQKTLEEDCDYYVNLYNDGKTREELREWIKGWCPRIIDLARKELEANYYTKVLDDRMVFKSDLHDRDLQKAYEMGKQDALKDLPKWKSATEHKDLEKHIAILEEGKVLLSNYLEEGDYYIELEDLKTLPKEE